MGIYDRDYYRKEGPSYLNALIPSGRVCKWLIALNIAIWIVQMVTSRPAQEVRRPADPQVQVKSTTFTEFFDLRPQKVIEEGQVWRLLTYAFLHSTASYWHILFNMLFLWWFGSDLEQMYGPKEFLAFYLSAALLGGLTGVAFYWIHSHDPTPGLGASGAITALLLLFACHFPQQRILIFYLIPVPIWLLVVFQIAQDTFGALNGIIEFRANAGVVHLSGAVFGYLYYRYHWHILGLLGSLGSWKLPRSRPRLHLYRPEKIAEPVSVSNPPSSMHLDEHLEAKLDAVLEKVARFGKDSLTEAERQILLKASEIYKRKRT